MPAYTINPLRGEIWFINFDPQIGSETRKRRPALVVSADGFGKLPLRIVVPITEWKAKYDQLPWFVKLDPTNTNGLTKESGADGFQVKSVALERFVACTGRVTPLELNSIVTSVTLCIGA